MGSKQSVDFTAKRRELEYLVKQGIPVPESYGTIYLGEMLGTSVPNDLILRSGEGDGFEGIFDSPIIHLRSKILEEYCKNKGFDVDEIIKNMQFDVQKYYDYGLTGKIYQHPHKENTYFISTNSNGALGICGFDFKYEKPGCFEEHSNIIFPKIEKIEKSNSRDSYNFLLPNIIRVYDLVSSKYNDGWIREMEFGIGLHSEDVNWHCLQTRKFRKKEKADWTLDTSEFPKIQTTNQVFGITPKEGLEMNLFYPDWSVTIYYNEQVENVKEENLLFQGPMYPEQKIPCKVISKTNGLIFSADGVLGDHTKVRYANDTSILIFTQKKLFGLEDDFKEYKEYYDIGNKRRKIGAVVPVKVYSDGLHVAIDRML